MTDEELIGVLVDTEAGLSPTEGYGPTIEAVRALIAERDRLRAVVAEYQRTLHQLDADLEDDHVDGVVPQYRSWKKAQAALLELPTADAKEST